jgi:hypothetical protein
MNITISKASLKTLDTAIASVLNVDLQDVITSGYKVMKNGCYQISYIVNGRKCSRFISAKVIAKAALTICIASSSSVNFVVLNGGMAKTDAGHVVTKFGCGCPDFKSNCVPSVDGFRFCEHLVAFNRDILGLGSLRAAIAHRNQAINQLWAS